MVDETEHIPTTFASTTAQLQDHKEEYVFILTYERAKFNSCIQREGEDGEPVESMATALHVWAQTCEFGILKEELIYAIELL